MQFLGNIKSPHILKLNKIVESQMEEYDREIDELIQKLDRLLYENEVIHMEQQVVDNCLANYDEEAVPYMGHPVDPNWRAGGGDNLEVRKRMLLRELDKKRSRLSLAVEENNRRLRADLQRYLDAAHKFARETISILPLPLEELQRHFVTLDQQFDSMAKETSPITERSYPDGVIGFDYSVRGELVKEVEKLFTGLAVRNEELLQPIK
jgi:regulator of replication initiation timing